MSDGEYTEESSDPETKETVAACALVAAAIPVEPPRSWFDDPQMRDPAPLHITDEGRVFGHIAAWHVSHLGLPGNTRPPKSGSDYAYFKTGVVRTDNGDDVHVGQLTLAGGHAALNMNAQKAVEHYDQTESAVADVTVGEDAFGIWVAGALRPGVTPEQIRTLRASSPSGDWRPINNRLELVAVCQVNVPGFPVARAQVASGAVTALVAAGASAIAQLKGPTVEDRVAQLETEKLQKSRQEVSERFAAMAAESTEESLFRQYSKETREDYAREGKAMKSGQYPIDTVQDLRNAIRASGRAAEGEKSAVRKHIIKRARALGKSSLVPDAWAAESAEMTQLRFQAIAASLRVKRPFDESKYVRDRIGRFDEKIAELEQEEETREIASEEAIVALEEAKEAARSGDLEDADRLAKEAEAVMERREEDALERTDALKESYRDLGEALGTSKIIDDSVDIESQEAFRFTDIAPPIQTVFRSMIDELKAQAPEAYEESIEEILKFLRGGDLATVGQIQAWIAELAAHLMAISKTGN